MAFVISQKVKLRLPDKSAVSSGAEKISPKNCGVGGKKEHRQLRWSSLLSSVLAFVITRTKALGAVSRHQ